MHVLIVGNALLAHVIPRAEALAGAGIRVTVLTPCARGSATVTELAYGTPPTSNAIRAICNRFANAVRFFRLFRTTPHDLVNVHYGLGDHAWFAMLRTTTPLAVTTMGGDIFFDQRADMRVDEPSRRLNSLLLRSANLVTVKNRHMFEQALRLGARPETLRILPWGVDEHLFRPVDRQQARQTLGLPEDRFIVLSSRDLKPVYNIDTAINAFARARQDRTNLFMVIAGRTSDPAYEAGLRAQVHEAGLDQDVMFLGSQNRENMPLLLSACDLSLSLALSDGLPQTVLESMACGTPCVVGDLPQLAELAEPGTGYLTAPLNAEDVARAVIRLADDAALLTDIRDKGITLIRDKAGHGAHIPPVVEQFRTLVEHECYRRPSRATVILLLLGSVLAPLWTGVRNRLGKRNRT